MEDRLCKTEKLCIAYVPRCTAPEQLSLSQTIHIFIFAIDTTEYTFERNFARVACPDQETIGIMR